MNRNMQEDCNKAYQHKVEERVATEECKDHFYWWMDFKSLPPKDQIDYQAPWERGWENIFDCLDQQPKRYCTNSMHFAWFSPTGA